MKLILASNSPRRKDILTEFGYEFSVCVSDFNEAENQADEYAVAKLNAEGKAKDVFSKLTDKDNSVVLGADTVVCFNGKILGKPKSKKDAVDTLKKLSGKVHTVITGYSICAKDKTLTAYTETKVKMNDLSDDLINLYVQSGLPLDKAGSYGIQDGYPLVNSYDGSLYNVIGLPIEDVKKALTRFGIK